MTLSLFGWLSAVIGLIAAVTLRGTERFVGLAIVVSGLYLAISQMMRA